MIEGAEHIAIESKLMDLAQTLVKLPTDQIEAAIDFRKRSDFLVSCAMPDSARLVSQKSIATMQIVLFAIGELRRTVPTSAELENGSRAMLERMRDLMGAAS